jgi:hypothetical protein
MRLFVRPNEFLQPDYTVTCRTDDGRALSVGRIFHASAEAPQSKGWVWIVDAQQRKGRLGPFRGRTANFEDATIAWKRCWESADVPINWSPQD